MRMVGINHDITGTEARGRRSSTIRRRTERVCGGRTIELAQSREPARSWPRAQPRRTARRGNTATELTLSGPTAGAQPHSPGSGRKQPLFSPLAENAELQDVTNQALTLRPHLVAQGPPWKGIRPADGLELVG